MGEESPVLLIAEDDPRSAQMLNEMLTMAGYKCQTATDGNAAITAARTGTIDLILLDVRIPGRNGYEVCELLKADPWTVHIPIVMVTAMTEEHCRLRAINAGADDFLTKPVNRAELYARIRALLRMRKRLAQRETIDAVVNAFSEMIRLSDPELARHSSAVSDLAATAANLAGLGASDVCLARQAGLLHDLGKAAWHSGADPATIEKEHPVWGEQILVSGPLAQLAPLVRGHHERWDGSGYPDGLVGPSQSQLLQILAAANAWEHLMQQHRAIPTTAKAFQKQIRCGLFNPLLLDLMMTAAADQAPHLEDRP